MSNTSSKTQTLKTPQQVRQKSNPNRNPVWYMKRREMHRLNPKSSPLHVSKWFLLGDHPQFSFLHIPHSDHHQVHKIHPLNQTLPTSFMATLIQTTNISHLESWKRDHLFASLLTHYWRLSTQKLNRLMKSKVGSHNCTVWIFQQLSVLLRIKRVVLIAVYGRLCMVGLFTTSLISSPTILPTRHSAPPYFGLLSVLHRCQAHSFKTYLPYLAQSAFCSVTPLLRN